MKIRITPLSIIAALFLVGAVYYAFFFKMDSGQPRHLDYGKIFGGGMLLFAVVAFFSDMLFRVFVKELKKLWIIEAIFIALAWLFMMIVNR